MRLITFLDVEASGLQDQSYPIEIAWLDTYGNTDSFLIIPESDWTHWDPNAEQMHGIAREKLFAQGIGVAAAAKRLNQALGNKLIFCDAVEFDGYWLNRLFDAVGLEQQFVLSDIAGWYSEIGPERQAAIEELLNRATVEHRALSDCQRYITAIQSITRT